jgi:hypothetical protein
MIEEIASLGEEVDFVSCLPLAQRFKIEYAPADTVSMWYKTTVCSESLVNSKILGSHGREIENCELLQQRFH